MSRSLRASKSPIRWLGVATVIGVTAATFAALTGGAAQATDWSACLHGSSDTQAVFERAARIAGVPEDVLLGVGYLSSLLEPARLCVQARPVATASCT